jgi:hypothetical protein
MSDVPDVPPWEPIADWLCRIEDGDHGTATQQERREYHEKTAKAIAYDIATHDVSEQIQQDLVEHTRFHSRGDDE